MILQISFLLPHFKWKAIISRDQRHIFQKLFFVIWKKKCKKVWEKANWIGIKPAKKERRLCKAFFCLGIVVVAFSRHEKVEKKKKMPTHPFSSTFNNKSSSITYITSLSLSLSLSLFSSFFLSLSLTLSFPPFLSLSLSLSLFLYLSLPIYLSLSLCLCLHLSFSEKKTFFNFSLILRPCWRRQNPTLKNGCFCFLKIYFRFFFFVF